MKRCEFNNNGFCQLMMEDCDYNADPEICPMNHDYEDFKNM